MSTDDFVTTGTLHRLRIDGEGGDFNLFLLRRGHAAAVSLSISALIWRDVSAQDHGVDRSGRTSLFLGETDSNSDCNLDKWSCDVSLAFPAQHFLLVTVVQCLYRVDGVDVPQEIERN